MAKTKKIRFTKAELNLLLNPPTPETWICPFHKGDKGVNFTIANSGKDKRCWLCCKEKPKKVDKPWDSYVAACAKMGVEPGTSGYVVSKLMQRQSEEAQEKYNEV